MIAAVFSLKIEANKTLCEKKERKLIVLFAAALDNFQIWKFNATRNTVLVNGRHAGPRHWSMSRRRRRRHKSGDLGVESNTPDGRSKVT